MNIDDEAAVFGGIDETNKPGPRGFKNMKVFWREPQGLSSARRHRSDAAHWILHKSF